MHLDTLRHLIEHSSAVDWSKLNNAGATPQFISLLKEGQAIKLDVQYHNTLLTYVEDISIQVAYGKDADFPGTGSKQYHPLSFDWAQSFPHPTPRRVLVNYMHNGNVVDEISVLWFDGAWMPFPERVDGQPQFSGQSLRVARLLQALDYPNDAEEQVSLLRQSGLPVAE